MFSFRFLFFYLPLRSFPKAASLILVTPHRAVLLSSEPDIWDIVPLSAPLSEQTLKMPKRDC